MRLLLVEDDALNVELFEAALEPEHELVVERDGPAGYRRALEGGFDLILLDIHLPGMRGDEICTALRDARVSTPIVALTASAMRHEIETASAHGFDAYLTKPIAPADLRDAVRRYARLTA
jgi:CheY-like chemotaxis protein